MHIPSILIQKLAAEVDLVRPAPNGLSYFNGVSPDQFVLINAPALSQCDPVVFKAIVERLIAHVRGGSAAAAEIKLSLAA